MANGDGVSLMTSGGLTLGATQIEPLVKWMMLGHPSPAPDNVVAVIAVGVVLVLHMAQKIISGRMAIKVPPAVTAAAATVLLVLGLGGLTACTSAQLAATDADIQAAIAKAKTDVATVSGDITQACQLMDDLNAGFPILAAINATVASATPVVSTAYAAAHDVCLANTAISAVVSAPSIATVLNAIVTIQIAVKPAISTQPAT